jgi:hypothetical protein
MSQTSHTCKVTDLAPRQSWPLQTIDLSLSIRDASTNLPQYGPSKEDLAEDHQLKGEDVTGRAEVLEAGSIRIQFLVGDYNILLLFIFSFVACVMFTLTRRSCTYVCIHTMDVYLLRRPS